MALWAYWRSSISPIRWKARTSKRRSTSRRRGFPNPWIAPLRNVREIRRELWDYRMDQSTPSFGSTRLECGHWKSRPGRSVGSALEPCDFLLMGQVNQSGSKSCFFAMRWNSLDGIPAHGEKAALRARLVHLPHQEKIAGLERRAHRSAGARLPVATLQPR